MAINTNDGVTAIVTWYVSTVASNLRSYVASGTLNLTLASLAKMYFGFGIAAGSGSTCRDHHAGLRPGREPPLLHLKTRRPRSPARPIPPAIRVPR